jgi:hypothetical protein
MNLYNQEELDRIKKVKETDKLEEFFNGKRTEWNDNANPFKSPSIDISNPTIGKILDTQALALSYIVKY